MWKFYYCLKIVIHGVKFKYNIYIYIYIYIYYIIYIYSFFSHGDLWRHDKHYLKWKVLFWICLLNKKSLYHETWKANRSSKDQHFSEIFSLIWGTLASNYLITPINHEPIMVIFEAFHSFDRTYWHNLKSQTWCAKR